MEAEAQNAPMPVPSEFVEHVVGILQAFGPVQARAMFGGWGLYREGLFFGLIAQDTLYFKVDEDNAAAFEARRLPPFVYESKLGDRVVMSYRQVPAEALESPEEMAAWARLGFAAALRAASKRPARRATAKPRP